MGRAHRSTAQGRGWGEINKDGTFQANQSQICFYSYASHPNGAEPEMQAWWAECMGRAGGAAFMQRFMDTQMYSNHRYSDAIRCVLEPLKGHDS